MRRVVIGVAALLVVGGVSLGLVNMLGRNVEAGMWQPTAAIPTGTGGKPESWREVRKFAISMDSGICVDEPTEGGPTFDHVEVEETDEDVTITAFAEVDTGGGCDRVGVRIDAGTVTLAQPLGNRKLIDGSVDHRYVVGPRSDRAWDSYLEGPVE